MGVDLLDITFRAEKAFEIQIRGNWLERVGVVKRGDDATLEQFHQMLLRMCEEQQVAAPTNSWELVVKVVEDATGFRNPQPTTTLREVAPDG